MEIDCRGKRVLITAGGGGIGRVIAETFDANGAKVHTCDISGTALDRLAAERPGITSSRTDVGDPDQVDVLIDEALERLGGLDVLINNAGIAGPTAAVEDIATADWTRTIDVCLNAMFYTIRRAVPVMKDAGSGCIINMSSASGRLAFPLRAPYAVGRSTDLPPPWRPSWVLTIFASIRFCRAMWRANGRTASSATRPRRSISPSPR